MKRIWIAIALATLMIALAWFMWPRGPRGFSDDSEPWDEPFIVDSVISRTECKEIIKNCEPKFAKSELVGVPGGDGTRTSETAWISKNDPIAQKILKKACELTGKEFRHCEDLQVVRYKPGAFYRTHHDSCCEDTEACKDFEKRGGQRVGTLLVYLNDDFTEGHTHFPNFGDKKYKVDPGSAVFFRPLGSDDARCHPRALHAGLPVASGVKYVCNAWVREGNFK